ncbi:hypothetical protein TNCV_3304051 [Trichonephila clavipes]|nr:hypothetical protein TNCV_3304051 [Trichonephila clavipes]
MSSGQERRTTPELCIQLSKLLQHTSSRILILYVYTVNSQWRDSAEVPETQGYEERSSSDGYPGSGENDSRIRSDRFFFHVQSGRGRERINSTVVEEVATAVQESSGGFQPCSAQGNRPNTGQDYECFLVLLPLPSLVSALSVFCTTSSFNIFNSMVAWMVSFLCKMVLIRNIEKPVKQLLKGHFENFELSAAISLQPGLPGHQISNRVTSGCMAI